MKKVEVKKVVLLGNSGVGKTSIIKRFVYDKFSAQRISTKMAAYLTKVVEAPNTTYKLQIWDTMGQEKYNSLTPFYYRDADIIIFVYDKTEYKSFTRVKELVNSALNNCTKDPFFCINKNKIDMVKDDIPKDEVLQFARDYDMFQTETSAMTGEGIKKLFKDIVFMLDNKKLSDQKKKKESKKNKNPQGQRLTSLNIKKKEKKKTCC